MSHSGSDKGKRKGRDGKGPQSSWHPNRRRLVNAHTPHSKTKLQSSALFTLDDAPLKKLRVHISAEHHLIIIGVVVWEQILFLRDGDGFCD